MNELEKITQEYKTQGYVFVQGSDMYKLLQVLNLELQQISYNNLKLLRNNLSKDPTMPRFSANGRFILDFVQNNIVQLKQVPFVLRQKDGFIRKDSDQERNFAQIGELANNLVFQTLMKLHALLISDIMLEQSDESTNNIQQQISTVFQIKTIKKPHNSDDLEGKPAPEGAHCDIGLGQGHIATIFIDAKNMTDNSAVSHLLSGDKKDFSDIIGKQYNVVDNKYIKAKVQHRNFLDTLFFIDRPHTVSDIRPKDESEIVTRDMLLLMSRPIRWGDDLNTHDKGISFDM